ncbi:MAG: HAMP domain-containing sensor histidine kinase, partial [Bacteroidota bacterium]
MIVSLLLYIAYSTWTDLIDYEDGLLPAILIPAIVAPLCSSLIRRYVNRIKQQNKKLSELNAINKQLLSVIAHDLRDPLASVKGFMELQFSGILSKEEFDDMGKELLMQVEQVLNLQEGILEWARQQKGLKRVSLEYFKIGDIIKNVIELYDRQLRTKEITLEASQLDDTIYSDQDIFSFVFRNIYHNAIKFTPKGGVISVRSYLIDDICELSVKDTGMGMKQEEIDLIMDTNHQFTKRGTNDEKGTGFGLNASINYLKE